MSFAEAKALASGDPLVLQKATADADLARLERLSRAHHRNLSAVTVRVHHADAQVAAADTDLPLIRQGMDRTIDTRGDAFTATINGAPFADRSHAAAAVRDWLTSTVRRYGADRERDLGTVANLGGHQVTATEVPHRGAAPDVRFALAGIPRSDWTLGYEHVRDTGGIRQMENRITGLPELHRRVTSERTQAQGTADDGRRALARPFKHADDLTQARARVEQITTDIHTRQTPTTTHTPAPAETPATPGFADRLHQLSDRMKTVSTTIAGLRDDSENQIPDQDIHVDNYDKHTASISTGAPRL